MKFPDETTAPTRADIADALQQERAKPAFKNMNPTARAAVMKNAVRLLVKARGLSDDDVALIQSDIDSYGTDPPNFVQRQV